MNLDKDLLNELRVMHWVQKPESMAKPEKKLAIILHPQTIDFLKAKTGVKKADAEEAMQEIWKKEIDQLVYKLYELTPKEIKIVEEFGKW